MEGWTKIDDSSSDSEGSWCLISHENKCEYPAERHSSSVERGGETVVFTKAHKWALDIEGGNEYVDEKHGASIEPVAEQWDEKWDESDQEEEVDWGEESGDTKAGDDDDEEWDDDPAEVSAADLVTDTDKMDVEVFSRLKGESGTVFSEKDVLTQHQLLAMVKNQRSMKKTGGKGKNFALQAALIASFSETSVERDTKKDSQHDTELERCMPRPETARPTTASRNKKLLQIFQESYSSLRDGNALRRVLEKSKYDTGKVIDTDEEVEGGVSDPCGPEEDVPFGTESADALLSYLKGL